MGEDKRDVDILIVGIVVAKANSNRFPGKNEFIIDNEPLFWFSVKPLLESKFIHKVYVATDSQVIKKYCDERGVSVIWRPQNATVDEDPLLSILKFAYYNLDIPYEIVVTIMANCPGHTSKSVDEAIEKMLNGGLWEIRSFNNKNEESGLLVFQKNVIKNHFQISSHIGAVLSDVKEIHYKEDINELYR